MEPLPAGVQEFKTVCSASLQEYACTVIRNFGGLLDTTTQAQECIVYCDSQLLGIVGPKHQGPKINCRYLICSLLNLGIKRWIDSVSSVDAA